MNPEHKISENAFKIFLKYGYHATTIQRIAAESNVSKAAVHYYFRNKKRIYTSVIESVVSHMKTKETNVTKFSLFFINELYNNKELFLETLNSLNVNIDIIEEFLRKNIKKILPEILGSS